MKNSTQQYIRLFLGIFLFCFIIFIPIPFIIISGLSSLANCESSFVMILFFVALIILFFVFIDEKHRIFLLDSCHNCSYHQGFPEECCLEGVDKETVVQSKENPIFTKCKFHKSTKINKQEQKNKKKKRTKNAKCKFDNEGNNKENNYKIIK